MEKVALAYLINRIIQRRERRRLFRKRMRALTAHHRLVQASCIQMAAHFYANQVANVPLGKPWKIPRDTGYWINVLNNFNNDEWMETFHLSKTVFFELNDVLQNELAPKPNHFRSSAPASASKKLAVVLYKLAHGENNQQIGDLFGIHKTTVRSYFHEVIDAVNKLLAELVTRWPDAEECQEIAAAFEANTNIPQIIGCIDSTHIPTNVPVAARSDFINSQSWTSLYLQVVVDDKFQFRNVCCSHRGNIGDAAALRDSDLYRRFEETYRATTRNICGQEVPYVLVGDPTYPLLPWLIKEYIAAVNQQPEQEVFNECLQQTKSHAQIAIGRLKARWQILSKRNDVSYQFMQDVIKACCILHNYVQHIDETTFPDSWLDEVRNNCEFQQPMREMDFIELEEGEKTRCVLSQYLLTS